MGLPLPEQPPNLRVLGTAGGGGRVLGQTSIKCSTVRLSSKWGGMSLERQVGQNMTVFILQVIESHQVSLGQGVSIMLRVIL